MSFAQPFQDYEILDRVGAGAMGTVFKARHKRLSRIVALKVLKPSLARDVRYVDRLRREARIVAALNHPNIVAGYDLGEEAGYHYFVMEFVEGKSLRGLLAEWGIFAEDQVRKVARQVAEALDHAVQRGVIHRDIKPGNILIDDQGVVKLTDMGLAKGPADLTLTRDGATVGTPQYISPEQARNPHDVDVRSDLYSLGATLYHMATGTPPFRGETMAEVITKVLHEVPAAPRDLNPALSEGLSLVIRKLLAKNLQVRYQTPRELLDDLDRLDAAQPVAVDESRLVAAEAGAQPSVWLWSLGVTLVAALLFAAVWVGMQLRPEPQQSVDAATFLRRLDADLASKPRFEERLELLQGARQAAPAGVGAGIEQRQNQAYRELQAAIEAVVHDLRSDGAWAATRGWLAAPAAWPGRDDYVRGRLDPALMERVHLLSSRLPAGVSRAPIDQLLADVGNAVKLRDSTLQERFRRHLEVVLPQQLDNALRGDDFVRASRLLDRGLSDFFDGVEQPLLDRVDAPLAESMRKAYDTFEQQQRTVVGVAESGAAAALRGEAKACAASLLDQIDLGADPDLLRTRSRQLREALAQAHPPSSRFLPATDPWPAIDATLRALDQRIELFADTAERQRFERMLDFAWRAFLGRGDAAAREVLGESPPDGAPEREPWQRHRAALTAAGSVADAVVRGLAKAPPPIHGHPLHGPPVELRVDSGDGPPQLWAQQAGGSARLARLTEFRFTPLLQLGRQAMPELFAELQPEVVTLGQAVLRLCGDEVEPRADAPGFDPFLRDEVWPRIVRARDGGAEAAGQRGDAWTRLQEAWRRAEEQGDVQQLVRALDEWQRFRDTASVEEQRTFAQAAAWLQREQHRQQVAADLRANNMDAAIDVRTKGDLLRAEVVMPATALRRGARDGWQQRGSVLEFGGGVTNWPESGTRRLRVDARLPAAARVECSLDLVLPDASAGLRIYVLEFRGVGCVLTATADERLVAAFVDGDPRRLENVQNAYGRALQQTLLEQKPGAVLLPNAVHRLHVSIVATDVRRPATATVSLDQQELCQKRVPAAADPLPELSLLPLQDVLVHRATIAAEGAF